MTTFSLIAFAAPLGLFAAAILAFRGPGMRPAGTLRVARLASGTAFAIALACLAAVIVGQTVTTPLIGWGGLGLAMRLDPLSVTMFTLVSFIGVIVLEFSRNYMDGDARQGQFIGWLAATLASVILVVTAGNLVQLLLAWIATSLFLHRLIAFYSDRPIARIAARKKFIVARIGDICLASAAAILFIRFGTGDIGAISSSLKAIAAADAASGLGLPALLIVLAALLKSAQFPAHGWLTEVIETPTPVSALLHAGIINAGGFLVIRFSDLMVLSASSLHLLAIVGGFTALFGGLVMLTQPSVKVSLAWSTISQMGFMMMQCGFGAFALATAHIVAHSLYKAHAFLASGSAIEWARLTQTKNRKPLMPVHFGGALALALAVYAAFALGLNEWAEKPAATIALGAILTMGLSLYVMRGIQARSSRRLIVKVVGTTVLGTAIYFAVNAISAAWLGGVVAPVPSPDWVSLTLMCLAVLSLLAIIAIQMADTEKVLPARWRTHIANGLYVNALFNRFVSAHRLAAARNRS